MIVDGLLAGELRLLETERASFTYRVHLLLALYFLDIFKARCVTISSSSRRNTFHQLYIFRL
jgi:hypothetical protein